MNCPKCGGVFEPVVLEEVEIDRCSQCHGLWFDVGEEEQLRRIPGSAAIDHGDPRTGMRHDSVRLIACPRDNTTMMTLSDFEQPHIHFEVCPTCLGAYFDAGEFRDLVTDGINLLALLGNIRR